MPRQGHLPLLLPRRQARRQAAAFSRFASILASALSPAFLFCSSFSLPPSLNPCACTPSTGSLLAQTPWWLHLLVFSIAPGDLVRWLNLPRHACLMCFGIDLARSACLRCFGRARGLAWDFAWDFARNTLVFWVVSYPALLAWCSSEIELVVEVHEGGRLWCSKTTSFEHTLPLEKERPLYKMDMQKEMISLRLEPRW